MAITSYPNCYVAINGVDLSDHTFKVTTEDTREPVEITAMGAVNRAYTKGLGDGKATIDLYQDFAAAKTHATLQALIGSSTPVTIEIRPVNAARSATNPAFLMSGLLMNYNMLDVTVGETSVISYEFQNAAQAGITYPTA